MHNILLLPFSNAVLYLDKFKFSKAESFKDFTQNHFSKSSTYLCLEFAYNKKQKFTLWSLWRWWLVMSVIFLLVLTSQSLLNMWNFLLRKYEHKHAVGLRIIKPDKLSLVGLILKLYFKHIALLETWLKVNRLWC